MKANKKINFLVLATVMLTNFACTTLSFRSYGEFPINIGPRKFHGVIQEHFGEKDFYLWGIIPYEHKVYLDDIMKEYNFISAANVEIEEYQNSKNFLLSLISFGLYVPRNYRVKFYGKK